METINNFCVYKHTSPSEKCYIGITCQDPEYRWGCNGSKYLEIKDDGELKHPKFANAILKYGWNNFSHEILHENLSKEVTIVVSDNNVVAEKVFAINLPEKIYAGQLLEIEVKFIPNDTVLEDFEIESSDTDCFE